MTCGSCPRWSAGCGGGVIKGVWKSLSHRACCQCLPISSACATRSLLFGVCFVFPSLSFRIKRPSFRSTQIAQRIAGSD